MTVNELAAKVTDAFFDYDPYNGADYEDVLEITAKELMSAEGCYEIIIELVEMLIEAIA